SGAPAHRAELVEQQAERGEDVRGAQGVPLPPAVGPQPEDGRRPDTEGLPAEIVPGPGRCGEATARSSPAGGAAGPPSLHECGQPPTRAECVVAGPGECGRGGLMAVLHLAQIALAEMDLLGEVV